MDNYERMMCSRNLLFYCFSGGVCVWGGGGGGGFDLFVCFAGIFWDAITCNAIQKLAIVTFVVETHYVIVSVISLK